MPTPGGVGANPNAVLSRLNAAVEAIENLKEEFSAYKQKTHKALQIVSGQNKVLTLEHRTTQDRVKYLEQILEIDEVQDVEGEVESAEAPGQDASSEQAANDVEKRNALSIDAAESRPIKAAVNAVFKKLMGVSQLDGKNLPPYPYQISRDNPEWPHDSGTNRPLLRFMWKESATHRTNHTGLEKIREGVRQLGPTLHPACTKLLDDIYDVDLEVRIKTKFAYMASEWRKMNREVSDSESESDGDEDNIFTDPNRDREASAAPSRSQSCKPVLPSNRARASRNSRVTSKLTARVRKRPLSQYTDPKYDSAFIKNAMSDDEDNPDAIPGKAKQWISRAPDYRSGIVQALYNAVDAIPDPDPDKAKAATTRVRGPPLTDSTPPKAKELRNRVRAWQVKEDLLKANESWLSSGRVAPNGKLWGDDKDPEDTHKRKRNEHSEMRSTGKRKRLILDSSEMEKSKAELDELMNGTDINAILKDD